MCTGNMQMPRHFIEGTRAFWDFGNPRRVLEPISGRHQGTTVLKIRENGKGTWSTFHQAPTISNCERRTQTQNHWEFFLHGLVGETILENNRALQTKNAAGIYRKKWEGAKRAVSLLLTYEWYCRGCHASAEIRAGDKAVCLRVSAKGSIFI